MNPAQAAAPAGTGEPPGPTVLVIGLRATGAAVVELFATDRAALLVVDDRIGVDDDAELAERAAAAQGHGAAVHGPVEDWTAFFGRAAIDLVVPSPGVRPDHPAIVEARSRDIPVRSEIDIAAERINAPLVAITGTNGKTTVTELVTAMLEASGLDVACGGNIGTPLVSLVPTSADVVVAEVSSFQLEFTTEAFRPAVAVLLNIDDDHLDWHGGRAAYAAAKAQVTAHQGADAVFIYDVSDPAVVRIAEGSGAQRIPFSEPLGPVTLHDGRSVIDPAAMPRSLPHDRTNALAAAEAAIAAGANLDAIREVLRSYRTLPHRVALIADHDGIVWIDDSKATNPHATRRAIDAFASVVLCAGGLNKGLDLGTMINPNDDRVRGIIAFGAAADEIVAAFGPRIPVEVARDMDDVVVRARAMARPGDTVLLSPGCASFDAYRNYSERGDDFARAVRSALATVEIRP